jgi:hypothetical protein
MLQKIRPRWSDRPVVVAASGPSLTSEIAHKLGRAKATGRIAVIAVNDAVYPLWFADMLYSCDEKWWNEHQGCPGFAGEKWSSHGSLMENNKIACAERYGLNLVRGAHGQGFSNDPALVYYGSNAGFQAVNIAMHGAAPLIALVGFDMKATIGRRHFFGDHPQGLHRDKGEAELERYFRMFIREFETAARSVPHGVRIVNCTPGSALRCFETMDLDHALESVGTRQGSACAARVPVSAAAC